jgi:hypothetical protein
MIEEGSRRHCIGFLTTVEFHKYLSGSTSHAKGSLASVDVMTSGQEIRVKSRIMQQSLENDSLITGLSHVPDTAGATTGARVLVSVVLDIDFRSRVINPSVFAIYQLVSCSVNEGLKGAKRELRRTLIFKLARRATKPFKAMIVDKIHTRLTEDEAVA